MARMDAADVQFGPTSPEPWSERALATAILRTLLYADVFGYPMTLEEIHRYLVGMPATIEQVTAALASEALRPHLTAEPPYYALAERELHFLRRRRRSATSGVLWPVARRYARHIAALPFVSMVAVTGSLAVDNPRARLDDLDYIIVVRPGRTWLVRLMTIVLVHLARRHHVALCPNYILDSDHLVMTDRTLYTAHELAQMVPCYGLEVHDRLLAANTWMRSFLPNAEGANGAHVQILNPIERFFKAVGTALLGGLVGDVLEHWARWYQMRHLLSEATGSRTVEACFSEGVCKGHMQDYGRHIERTYAARLRAAGLAKASLALAMGERR